MLLWFANWESFRIDPPMLKKAWSSMGRFLKPENEDWKDESRQAKNNNNKNKNLAFFFFF